MTNRNRLCALLLAGAILTPLAAQAASESRDRIFCHAIGLSMEGRMQCADQLANATSEDDRASVQASWVSRSALATPGPSGGSLYQPMVDTNHKNGMPGTPYQDKPGFIPNTVARDIDRAVRMVKMNPPDAYQTGRIDQ